MAALVTKTKFFIADEVLPGGTTPVGQSLEEQVNTFLATLPTANVLDVVVNLSKSGKYGASPMFIGCVLYKS